MGRGDCRAPRFFSSSREGPGKRSAFRRVCARSQLVEKHEGAGSGPFQQVDDVSHVAAEGGERLLDALLVADVGEHFFEDRQAAVRIDRYRQADCAIRASRPIVLRATVLPPVFGPVIRSTRWCSSTRSEMGTGAVSRGCARSGGRSRPGPPSARRMGLCRVRLPAVRRGYLP